MGYQSLARKYRPASFRDLVGQEGVTRALANGILLGREQPALLLTGVRGVGKTTIARLFAKALNCANRGPDAEPCNACESCRLIAEGRHEDVMEIDGASNTGVADVRALQETVGYVPQRSPFKVYIIDEVHMLSNSAFNALLKTIEEPPPHVKFVFATTEINRVPETILSRCQAFYLRKFPQQAIRDRLAEILRQEAVPFEASALAVIAREGRGSMRDALTLLDHAIALGAGSVTAAALSSLVGNLSTSPYLDLLGALVDRDAAGVMAILATFDSGGVEFDAVVEELAALARHAFVLKGLGGDALDRSLLGLSDDELGRLDAIAQRAAEFDLNRIFRTFVQCRNDLDGSALDRYVVENYAYEWCFDPGLPDVERLLRGASAASQPKVASDLVRAVAAKPASAAPRPEQPKAAPVVAPDLALVSPESSALRPGASKDSRSSPEVATGWPSSWRELVERWKERKPLSARKLEEAHPVEFSPAKIVLGIGDESYASKCLLQKDEQLRIRQAFQDLFGFTGALVVVPMAELRQSAPAPNPQTLHEVRVKERQERRDDLIEKARTAPFTRDVLATLGGVIEDVRIPESDS